MTCGKHDDQNTYSDHTQRKYIYIYMGKHYNKMWDLYILKKKKNQKKGRKKKEKKQAQRRAAAGRSRHKSHGVIQY